MLELVRKIGVVGKVFAATALALIALLVVKLWGTPTPVQALLVILAPVGGGYEEGGRKAPGKTIALLENPAGAGSWRLIVQGFAVAGVPSVAYDGKRAIFAGRRAPGDPTGIWEVDLTGSTPRRVEHPPSPVADPGNGGSSTGHGVVPGGECLDPSYLPDSRIVYARTLPSKGGETSTALFTSHIDGTREQRITFGLACDRGPTVLPDGRIVFRRHSLLGKRTGRLFAVNPDGTGVQLFCGPPDGASIEGGPWLIDERVLFAEEMPPGSGQRLVSVLARQPMGNREILANGETEEWFSSVGKLPGDELAATVYVQNRGWTLRKFLPPDASSAEAVLSTISLPGFDHPFLPTGVALARPRTRPLSLTSVVDERKRHGTLLCLDVHTSRIPAMAASQPGTVAAVRVFAAAGLLLAEAPVEADGSFFIEVPADQPLHLELVGPDGVLAKDHSGFWVRPNENRGCIGCHEDPELAPENRAILALARKTAPVP